MAAETLDMDLSLEVFASARSICRESGSGCEEYHYLRPILRRIGAATSAYTHDEFYREAIQRSIQETEEPEITVSGTADYSWFLPTSPLRAAAQAQTRYAVRDACLSPLYASMQVSNALGLNLNAHRLDIRRTLAVTNQDAIVTDAFLTQFPEQTDRVAVLNQWRQALKLGGHAITTVQVRRVHANDDSQRQRSFVRNVSEMYGNSYYPEMLGLSQAQFAELVKAGAATIRSRIYDSEQELEDEVREAGLHIEDMSSAAIYFQATEAVSSYRRLMLVRR